MSRDFLRNTLSNILIIMHDSSTVRKHNVTSTEITVFTLTLKWKKLYSLSVSSWTSIYPGQKKHLPWEVWCKHIHDLLIHQSNLILKLKSSPCCNCKGRDSMCWPLCNSFFINICRYLYIKHGFIFLYTWIDTEACVIKVLTASQIQA